MTEESSPLLPPAEESIKGKTDTALEPEPESAESTPEPTSEPSFVCAIGEWMRSACDGLPFYREHESNRYCVLHYPGKNKSTDFKAALDSKLNKKDVDFRGVWFPDEVAFNGFDFSAAASFSSATFSADAYFIAATFSAAADFSSATFSAAADFSSATFSAAADFSYATFSAAADFRSASFSAAAGFTHATFGADALFSSATFSGAAHFISATFSAAANFSSTTFSADAYFSSATFSAATDFRSATFSAAAGFTDATFGADALFSSATFSEAAYFCFTTFSAAADFNLSVFHARIDFNRASFNDSIHFFGSASERPLSGGTLGAMAFGKDPSLDFQHPRIEHPERIVFHTLNLGPHWFVNVDSRQFVFTHVDWQWERISIKKEILALEANGVSSPTRLLAIACRQLAENAESNNRYEEASNFRYWAMDLARRTKWKGWAFWKTDWLHVLYWAVSGYGERIRNALCVLAVVWFVFALLYTQVGFAQQPRNLPAEGAAGAAASIAIEDRIRQPLEFSRALTYSLAVISLQKPEPKPLTDAAQTLVLLETILGPVQAALLALAIRRKFMR